MGVCVIRLLYLFDFQAAKKHGLKSEKVLAQEAFFPFPFHSFPFVCQLHCATPSHQFPVWCRLGIWLVQGAGGEDVVEGLLRLPCTVRQAPLPPGQPETAKPTVKATEEESNHHLNK